MSENRLHELQSSLETYNESMKNLIEVRNALAKWDKKTVTISWNKASGFVTTHKDWNRELVNYRLQKSEDWKSWCNYEMYISRNTTLEIKSRDTKEVLQATEEKITNMKEWIKSTERDIKRVETVDDEVIRKELIAIREKYQPEREVWKELLKDYSVMYYK